LKRYIPQKDFPAYAFVPGQHPHPEKEGGHMFGEEVSSDQLLGFKDCPAYLYAIDLYNYGYYWEAHVWWECLWHLENRTGDLADFLKALIKLSAGKLKMKMGQEEIANNHIERGLALITELSRKHEVIAGVDLDDIRIDYSKIELDYLEG
jgi:hypothetical protein